MSTFAKVGINQIYLCDVGTLLTSPASGSILGLRPPGELIFEDFETTDDYRGRPLRNMINAKISAKTNQPTLLKLSDILTVYLVDMGADVELYSVPQATTVDGGCFQFNGATNYMGVDFTYLQSAKERTLLYELEVALEFLNMKALIDASDANTPAVTGESNYGIDPTIQRYPWHKTISDGSGAIFAADEILDYSFHLKPIGKKSLFNRLIVDYIECNLEITGRNAVITKMISTLAGSMSQAITIQQDTSLASATYEKFVFAAGCLHPTQQFKVGDDERYIKQIWRGRLPIGNLSFSFLVGAGGGTSADGTEGGTCTITL